MTREDAAALRGQVLRAVVHQVDDGAAEQRLVVETHEGVMRSGVEVLLPYGLASAPAGGAMTVVLAVGGDQGDLVALPAAAARMGGLAAGEVALYDDSGSRLHLKAGGVIEATAATEIRVVVGATVFSVTATGVAITGNLQVTGNITATGTITP